MHVEKKLADFSLAVGRHTTKPPNFPAIRYMSVMFHIELPLFDVVNGNLKNLYN